MHDVELQKVALRDHSRVLRGYYDRRCQDPDGGGRWSMAFTHTHPEFWNELTPVILTELEPAHVQGVADHFSLIRGASMLPPEVVVHEQLGLKEVLDLVCKGHLYVKLSAPYCVNDTAP